MAAPGGRRHRSGQDRRTQAHARRPARRTANLCDLPQGGPGEVQPANQWIRGAAGDDCLRQRVRAPDYDNPVIAVGATTGHHRLGHFAPLTATVTATSPQIEPAIAQPTGPSSLASDTTCVGGPVY